MSTPIAGKHGRPAIDVYEAVTLDWSRQVRQYVQSIRLYREVTQRHVDRQRQQPGPVLRSDTRPSATPTLTVVPRTRLTQGAVPDTADDAPSKPGGRRASRSGPLTGRQLEIAELIARGLTNGQIAEKLVLTPGTIGNHVAHILRRLGVRNRAQVAAWMVKHDERDELVRMKA